MPNFLYTTYHWTFVLILTLLFPWPTVIDSESKGGHVRTIAPPNHSILSLRAISSNTLTNDPFQNLRTARRSCWTTIQDNSVSAPGERLDLRKVHFNELGCCWGGGGSRRRWEGRENLRLRARSRCGRSKSVSRLWKLQESGRSAFD